MLARRRPGTPRSGRRRRYRSSPHADRRVRGLGARRAAARSRSRRSRKTGSTSPSGNSTRSTVAEQQRDASATTGSPARCELVGVGAELEQRARLGLAGELGVADQPAVRRCARRSRRSRGTRRRRTPPGRRRRARLGTPRAWRRRAASKLGQRVRRLDVVQVATCAFRCELREQPLLVAITERAMCSWRGSSLARSGRPTRACSRACAGGRTRTPPRRSGPMRSSAITVEQKHNSPIRPLTEAISVTAIKQSVRRSWIQPSVLSVATGRKAAGSMEAGCKAQVLASEQPVSGMQHPGPYPPLHRPHVATSTHSSTDGGLPRLSHRTGAILIRVLGDVSPYCRFRALGMVL